jgi:hypothetical protein
MTPQRENSGILFDNEKKQSATSPDLSGRINVGGREYFLSGWNKQGKRGGFLSLSVGKEISERPAPTGGNKDDDLPF